MRDQQPARRRIPVGVAAGISALVLAAGGATAWWTWNSVTTPEKNSVPTAIQPSPSPQPVQPSVDLASPTVPSPSVSTAPNPAQPSQSSQRLPAKRVVQVYWLKDTGRNVKLAPSQMTVDPAADKPNILLEKGFNGLLAGPADSNVTTTIPEGTKLRSVAVRNDGIHVDLSQEFTSGGGSTSMTGRVAQILYTATSLEPDARVWISVEGQPLETLGGEGLILDQPMTRKSFEQDFTL